MRIAVAVGSLALCLAVAGCGAHYAGDTSSNGSTGTTAATGSTGTSSTGGTTGSWVPVDWTTVSALFVTYCTTCHSPSGTASHYVDLTSQSASTADAPSIAAYVGAGLMPQNATITAADKATILNWANNPSGTCSTGSGTTGGSGSTGSIGPGSLGPQAACVAQNWGSAPWVNGGDPNMNMNPGDNCDQCHTNNPANTGDTGPRLNFGGTAYNDATGTALSSNATITVVDANGVTATATASVGNNGNFDSRHSSSVSLTPPYTVTITRGTTTLPMLHLAPSGACNSCHQVQANADPACVTANVTPGRIYAP